MNVRTIPTHQAGKCFLTLFTRLKCLTLVAVALVPFQRAPAIASVALIDDSLSDQPAISTLAGTGSIGFTDGRAAAATFVSPSGLAYDDHGALYVADRGSQRVRKIDPDGSVSTLAGSGSLDRLGIGVAGSYADGPASKARFNAPTGIAVQANGTVLVADQLNACVRAIAFGTVTTFAGKCGSEGDADGPPAVARFTAPRSIAITKDGTIFVVDPPNGVRAIRNGLVSHFASPHSVDATAVSAAPGPDDGLILAAASLIDVVDASSGHVREELPLETSYVSGATRVAVTPAGPLAGIAAFASDDFVYADPYDSAVFMVQLGSAPGNGGSYFRVLGSQATYEEPIDGPDVENGARAAASFDQPVALAVANDGSVAVADAAGRRIRRIERFNHDTAMLRVDQHVEFPDEPDASERRVALIGNSTFGVSQGWDDSIAGEVEKLMNAARPAGSKRVVVFPVVRPGTRVQNLLSLVDDTLADGGFDDVVVEFSDRGQFVGADALADAFFPPGWPNDVNAALKTSQRLFRDSPTKLSILIHPGAQDFEDETLYRFEFKGLVSANPLSAPLKDPSVIESYRDDVTSALRDTGLPVIDAWPPFLADHGVAPHRPLFGTWDNHMTPHGRQLLATTIANALSSESR